MIAVVDHGGNHEADQHRAHDRLPDADVAAAKRNDAHSERDVADAAADRDEEDDLDYREDGQGREGVVVEEGNRDDDRKGPVDEEGDDPATQSTHRPWPGLRQTEVVSGPWCGLLAGKGRRLGCSAGHDHEPIEGLLGEAAVTCLKQW